MDFGGGCNKICVRIIRINRFFRKAADILNVSQPVVVRLLETGKVPFKKVGRHRRVLYSDLKIYQEKQHRIAMQNLQKIAKESQKLGLY